MVAEGGGMIILSGIGAPGVSYKITTTAADRRCLQDHRKTLYYSYGKAGRCLTGAKS